MQPKRYRRKIQRTRKGTQLLRKRKSYKRTERWKLAIGMLCGAVAAVVLTLAVTIYMNSGLRLLHTAGLTLIRQPDDTMVLLWNETQWANAYEVEVKSAEETLFKDTVRGTQCTMPSVDSGEVHIKLRPIREAVETERKTPRRGKQISTSCEIQWPELKSFRATTEADGNSISFFWSGHGGNRYLLFHRDADGTYHPVVSSTGGKRTVRFGSQGDYPIPDYGGSYSFVGGCGSETSRITLCSYVSDPIVFERSDFFGSTIDLKYTDNGNNLYTFTWEEAVGEDYALQYRSDDITEWKTIQTITGESDQGAGFNVRLKPGVNYRLRMVGYQEGRADSGEYGACSQEIQLQTGASPIYATVWPIRNLTLYAETDRQKVIGQADAAKAYCVLEEKDGMFRVYTDKGYGYIDSGYCMINLPDFLGELCAYDIKNSYSAIYHIHGYEIPGVTNTVIKGYEEVWVGPDEYLVPLLYPTAQKLLTAAKDTLADGYRLKIYDAYRPYEASVDIYQKTEKYLNQGLADTSFVGEEGSGSLYDVMTNNGTYHLGSFLARSGSTHNLGIAVDITMVQLQTGAELDTQTRMHDLSFYSVTNRNTGSANLLRQYLTSAGFNTLVTEWWHFQDDDTRRQEGINHHLRPGVSPECWIKDETGWRYREANGDYIKGMEAEIGRETYLFDENGYASVPW